MKINIVTVAKLEGPKRHRKKDAPKGKSQCLGTVEMAHEVEKEQGLELMEISSHT